MRIYTLLQLMVMGVAVYGLSACGNKGKLKSPTQIEAAEAKKAKKPAQEDNDTTDADQDGVVLPPTEMPVVNQPSSVPPTSMPSPPIESESK